VKRRLGELLLERGVLRPEGLTRALDLARTSGLRLASQVLVLDLAAEGPVVSVLAAREGVPGVDLSGSVLATGTLGLIPREIAEFERILPLGIESGRLLLAMADPHDARVTGEIELITGLEVVPHVAVASRLFEVIDVAYAAAAAGESVWAGRAPPSGARTPHLEVHAASSPAASRPGELDIEVDILDDGEGEEVGSVSARVGPRLVLVVDDEEEILTLVEKALTAQGYRVETARGGQQALDRVNELLPDLVLLDANLPGIHGFDVCRKITSNRRFARVPIIMMTGVFRGWRFAHDSLESSGAAGYLEKPFRLDELRQCVERHVQRAVGEPERSNPLAERHYQEGVALLQRGRAREAAAAFELAVGADAFSGVIRYQSGRALQAAGDTWGAIRAYERAVELRPDLFVALRSLAALYQQKGFRRNVIQAWERALSVAPDDATRQKIKASLIALL
jgi:CheY-like chemotaxis protein